MTFAIEFRTLAYSANELADLLSGSLSSGRQVLKRAARVDIANFSVKENTVR